MVDFALESLPGNFQQARVAESRQKGMETRHVTKMWLQIRGFTGRVATSEWLKSAGGARRGRSAFLNGLLVQYPNT